MSCDSKRKKFLAHASYGTGGQGPSADDLESLYERTLASADKNAPRATQLQWRGRMEKLFEWFDAAGIGRPTHGQVPPQRQAAWAAIYDALSAGDVRRCDRCGGGNRWGDHRCPAILKSNAAYRAEAEGRMAELLPDALLTTLVGDDAALAERLRQTFLRNMRGLTDEDRAHVEPLMKSRAMRYIFEWAGAPLPQDLVEVDPDGEMPDDAGERQVTFPATWTGYAAVLDLLNRRHVLEGSGKPQGRAVLPGELPIWAIVRNVESGRVCMRIPRPEGYHNYNWFVTLAVPRDYDGDSDRAEGWVFWDLGEDEDDRTWQVMRTATPDRPDDEPRWEQYSGELDAATKTALDAARGASEPADRAAAVSDLAMRQETPRLRRKLLEEAVYWSRQVEDGGIGRTRQIRALARVAARAYLDGGVDDARFVAMSARDEFWASHVLRDARRVLPDGADLRPLYEARLDIAARAPNADDALGWVAQDAAEDGLGDIAVAAFSRQQNEFTQAKLARALVRDLPAESLGAFVDAARRIGAPDVAIGINRDTERAQAIGAALPRLSGQTVRDVAREVLALTQDGRQEETAAATAKAIVALAPHVDAAERGRLLELARGLSGTRYDDSWGRSAEEVQERALTGLIPSLEGAARDQAYAEAKRRALALPDTHYTEMPRFTALLRLLPHADAADRHAFAEQILSDFAGEKRWPRPDDVIATTPFLDSAQRARLLATAPELTRNWYDAPRAELAAALGVNHINNSAPESEKAG